MREEAALEIIREIESRAIKVGGWGKLGSLAGKQAVGRVIEKGTYHAPLGEAQTLGFYNPAVPCFASLYYAWYCSRSTMPAVNSSGRT